MLENAGPLRNDGSDKFWGMENVSPKIIQGLVPAEALSEEVSSADISSFAQFGNTWYVFE